MTEHKAGSWDRGKMQERGLMLFLALSILLFVLYPILALVKSSVWIDGGLSFREYRNLFQDNAGLLANSLFTGFLSACISTLWSLLLAIRIGALRGRARLLMLLLLAMALVSPPFLSSLSYIQLYGRRGLISYSLLHIRWNPYNEWGIIAMQSIHFISLSTLFLLSFLDRLDRRVIDASRDLGASQGRTYFHVILPLLLPAVAAAWILSFIRSVSDFGTPAVIGGRYDTLASAIYTQLIGYGRMEYAAAMNVLLLIPAVLSFLLYRLCMRVHGSASQVESLQTGEPVPLPHPHPGGIIGLLLRLGTLFYLILMLLQYGCIFLSGFLKSRKGVYRFTLEHFDSLFRYNLRSLGLSLQLSLIVALLGSGFALLLSYYLLRRRMPLGGFFDFIASLPYLLPGTCMGIGYILAFNRPPLKLTGTVGILVLSMLFKQLPAGLRVGSVAVLQISERIEEAARDLGAQRMKVLWQIVLPNLGQAFFTAFLYNFAASMTTAGAVLFLITARHKLAVYTLFDAINSGEYGVAALISSLMILLTVAVSGLVYSGQRYLTGRTRRAGSMRKGEQRGETE